MGCGSTHLWVEGETMKQEKIELEINERYKSKELTQAQELIHLITNIRNKIIYEYDNLIYTTGASLFKNPSISHCTKCILFKMCSECQGDINKANLSFREDPPYMKIEFTQFSQTTNTLLNQLFEFIVRLRDYKIIIKQLDKEIPKLMYIIYDNNNKISKINLTKINLAISLFQDLQKIRTNILVEYKNQIYDIVCNNKEVIDQINKIGELAYKNKITDIYEITMLLKDNIGEKEKNNKKAKLEIHYSIKEAKKKMEKKLENEKVEDIDSTLLTFSFKRVASFEDFGENINKINFNNV